MTDEIRTNVSFNGYQEATDTLRRKNVIELKRTAFVADDDIKDTNIYFQN